MPSTRLASMVPSKVEEYGYTAEEELPLQQLSAEAGMGQDVCNTPSGLTLTHSCMEEFGERAAYLPPEEHLVVFTPWAIF